MTICKDKIDDIQWWGKARGGVHPLLFHLIDVGQVARSLCHAMANRAADMGKLYSVPEDRLPDLIGYLAALHDIGKLSTGFQMMAPDAAPPCLVSNVNTPPIGCRHDRDAQKLFSERLDVFNICFEANDDAEAMLSSVAGHHGEPVVGSDGSLRQIYSTEALIAAVSIQKKLSAIFPPPDVGALSRRHRAILQRQLAGWVNLADWIGSNPDWFPPAKGFPEDQYAERSQQQAVRAVINSGLGQPKVSNPKFLSLFDFEPTPLQKEADSLKLIDGPGLYILEDLTGSGKTEAAATLAGRIIGAGHAEGAYFAMPTTATSDAIFDRLKSVYRKYYHEESNPSLALAHGKSALNDSFRRMRIADQNSNSREGNTPTAQAQCHSWLGENNRKALLADIGVGTVDQALLSILPVRFQALRLLGLTRKVLILDEVHSYDAYMSRGLERLIGFHAGQRGSVILLSATLSKQARHRFEQSFIEHITAEERATTGLRVQKVKPDLCELSSAEYQDRLPLISVLERQGVTRIPVEPRKGTPRRLDVARVSSPSQGERLVAEAAGQGAACIYLRNSVDDAIETSDRLRSLGLQPILFHARFAWSDRAIIESEVLRLFGKTASPSMRRGKVLVATQVVEQSLDLDFDFMVTDLAPVDLLIQRAGRLRRHAKRDETRPLPDAPLYIVSPDPSAANREDWLKSVLPRTHYVYKNDALLWRSAQSLFTEGAIDTPGGTRALIENVYQEDNSDPVALQASKQNAQGTQSADQSVAERNFLEFDSGYTWLNKFDEARVSSRLSEPTRTYRLAKRQEGKIIPWSGEEGSKGWALSEISLRESALEGVKEPEDADLAKVEWTNWQKEEIALMVLEERDDGHGFVWRAEGVRRNSPVEITYREDRGMMLGG